MRALLLACSIALAVPTAVEAGRSAAAPSVVSRIKTRAMRFQKQRAQRRDARRTAFRSELQTAIKSSRSVADALTTLAGQRRLKRKLATDYHWSERPGEFVIATRAITTQVYVTRVERVLYGQVTEHDLATTPAQVSLVMTRRGLALRATYPELRQHPSVARAESQSLTSMTPAGKVGVDKRLGVDVKVWGAESHIAGKGHLKLILKDPMWKDLQVSDVANAAASYASL